MRSVYAERTLEIHKKGHPSRYGRQDTGGSPGEGGGDIKLSFEGCSEGLVGLGEWDRPRELMRKR